MPAAAAAGLAATKRRRACCSTMVLRAKPRDRIARPGRSGPHATQREAETPSNLQDWWGRFISLSIKTCPPAISEVELLQPELRVDLLRRRGGREPGSGGRLQRVAQRGVSKGRYARQGNGEVHRAERMSVREKSSPT